MTQSPKSMKSPDVMQAHLVQGSLPDVGQTQPDMGLIKSSDIRISLAQPSCPTWYRCRLELALTSCRHQPGASAAYRKQTRQSFYSCTINLQQKILQTYKLLTKISDWIANKL